MAKPAAVTGTLEGPYPANPAFGSSISFHVDSTFQLFVNVLAHQDGVLVMNSWAPYFPTRTEDPPFGLYSPVWQGGAAHCVANLMHYLRHDRYEIVDSVEFEVAA